MHCWVIQLRICQSVFQSCYATVHSHQQCRSISHILANNCYHLLYSRHSESLMVPHYSFICIFLVMNDAEHLFWHLSAIHASFHMVLFKTIPHLLTGLSSYWIIRPYTMLICIHCLYVFYQIQNFKYYLSTFLFS